ncbi:MAG: hypothetical protein Q9181_001198 [Wetmoreana brouardii]
MPRSKQPITLTLRSRHHFFNPANQDSPSQVQAHISPPKASRQCKSYVQEHGQTYGTCTPQRRLSEVWTTLMRQPQVNQGLQGQYRDILTTYWQQTINNLENETHDYKIHQLPLARIKKVMKADPEVKMISAEAPILFAKGCDIFITELTMRAWIHAEENKRRTLQRSDIASALAKSDMFDFLIDIVPREEAASHAKRTAAQAGPGSGGVPPASGPPNNQLLPPQSNVQQQPPPSHHQHQQQHHIAHPEYPITNNPIPQDQEYRGQPGIYASQVPQDPSNAYGQPQGQMFEGMYAYPSMAPQQVGHLPLQLFAGASIRALSLEPSLFTCLARNQSGIRNDKLTSLQMYQVSQRSQDPSSGQDPSHHYQRHDGGEVDADAEGDRDYEVG